ncbi:MAG: hypothetical protein SOW20_02620 [Berryella intestinalis]|uniref:hypothetical protein n=1 Tax=Berryella intestinalis TaxID=1531429 RepID=UPI002A530282|nr:hypothetical protein [Berryella intestinalis]MDD7369291.1 hypothetical protein [Berryella intestinalis]MDY3128904.1 hypothetical protein [Berryella intestinalis]
MRIGSSLGNTARTASSHRHCARRVEERFGTPPFPRWLQLIATIWTGQAFSIITSGAAGWAIIWHVTQTTQSALALSLVMVCAMLVPERHLLRINTLDQVLPSLANVCAPAIGIGLYAAFGLSFALVLEFAGAVAAVAAMLLVKIPTVRTEDGSSALGQMVEGWRALSATRGLVMLLGGLTVGLIGYTFRDIRALDTVDPAAKA